MNQQDPEILKAVAQAWYAHSGSSRPITEFHAHPTNFKPNPSRFRLQAMAMAMDDATRITTNTASASSSNWDFNHSLWDSYELVTVSRRLETGLALPFSSDFDFQGMSGDNTPSRRRHESKNSLRNLFNQMSSRRFNFNHTKLI